MTYAILVLITGLSISAVAAYYSIIGLTTIFSGAMLAVAIMGSVLEVGKLVTASWLYRNWKTAGLLIKSYLTIAVVVLMFITSMGIFGFLSKAHLEQTSTTITSEAKVEKIDFNINQQQTKIKRAQDVLDQLDKALDAYIQKEYITRGLKERAKQAPEREALQKEIEEANNKIEELSEKKFEIEQEVRDVEVEVGPIKYIAELIYGEEKAKGLLDEAVRAVILILIFVFDPLAVLLMIAANMSLKQASDKRKNNKEIKQTIKESKDNKSIDEWLDEKSPTSPVFTQESYTNIHEQQQEEKKIDDDFFKEPSKESLEEIPEITDFSKVKIIRPNKNIKPETNLSSSYFTEILPDKNNDDYNKEEQKTWADKILSKQIQSKDISKALDDAYNEAKGSAVIPFNLGGDEGEALKRLIVKNILRKLEEFD